MLRKMTIAIVAFGQKILLSYIQVGMGHRKTQSIYFNLK